LFEDLTLKDTICDQICTDLGDVTSERHIQRCLPDEYKQKRRKKGIEESTSQLPTNVANLPEQRSMTVENTGYEQAFEDVNRPNVE
jgi:hypothetical protein